MAEIWKVEEGEVRKPSTIHVATMIVLIGVGSVVGAYASLSLPLAFGVTFFWPAIAVQIVGGIWFGMWGCIAAFLFPFFTNTVAGAPLYISALYIPSNFLQAFIPAFAFRYLRANPDLRTRKGQAVLILFGIIINNLIGAALAIGALQSFGLITAPSLPLFYWTWFFGNAVAAIIFCELIMLPLSPYVMRARAFVKRWWA